MATVGKNKNGVVSQLFFWDPSHGIRSRGRPARTSPAVKSSHSSVGETDTRMTRYKRL